MIRGWEHFLAVRRALTKMGHDVKNIREAQLVFERTPTVSYCRGIIHMKHAREQRGRGLTPSKFQTSFRELNIYV